MKTRHLVIALGAIAAGEAAHAANRPPGYVTICNEGKTCSLSAPR